MRRPRDQSDLRRRGRAAVGWCVALFLTLVAAHSVALDRHPELYDVEYAARLDLLRARMAEDPDRPLLLVVGSSRTVMGFAPEQLPPLRTADGAEVLPFNFGHFGAGPLMNLMLMSRLLADGIRPRWMVLELMPSHVAHEGLPLITQISAARDLPVLHPHARWYRLYGDYLLRRLWAAPKVTAELLRPIAPDLCPVPWGKAPPLLPLGGCTFLKDEMPAAERARLTEVARVYLKGALQTFQISTQSDGAIRALLGRFRAEGVQTVLLLTPEGTTLQSWYAPGAHDRFIRYCAALGREYGVPIVDARAWLTEKELYDGHHPLKCGAATFTRRLGENVLTPYLMAGDTSWSADFRGR
jgi:hypothetical protein